MLRKLVMAKSNNGDQEEEMFFTKSIWAPTITKDGVSVARDWIKSTLEKVLN